MDENTKFVLAEADTSLRNLAEAYATFQHNLSDIRNLADDGYSMPEEISHNIQWMQGLNTSMGPTIDLLREVLSEGLEEEHDLYADLHCSNCGDALERGDGPFCEYCEGGSFSYNSLHQTPEGVW